MSLPEVWTPEKGIAAAKKNSLMGVYGLTKTGKTSLATQTNRTLYYAHFDPHDNLNDHLAHRGEQGFTSQAYPEWFYPVSYKNLTQESAQGYVDRLVQFAADARADCAKSGKEGLFVIDGGKRLKGYVEKALLGESATLGYRAKQGEKGVSSIEYAESNAYFADIVNSFVGSNCHLVVTFEAREKWVETVDDRGKKVRKPSGRYEPKMPNDVTFSLNALLETLVEAVPVAVVDHKQVFEFQHKIRFEYVGFVGMGALKNRTVPAMGFDKLLEMFHSNLPVEQIVEPAHEIKRVDMDDSLTSPSDGEGDD